MQQQMEAKTLLNALSPQLQALVEASLGEKLPVTSTVATVADGKQTKIEEEHTENKSAVTKESVVLSSNQVARSTAPTTTVDTKSVVVKPKLNPSDLFVLKHPDSPGFVVKNNFLGVDQAVAVRDALLELAQTKELHEAKVGHGESLRNERAVRGDRICWLQRPNDLNNPNGELHPSIVHLMKQVESLAYGLKKASPDLDLRNVTSTQFAIYPGDGSRFVKHIDTYSTAHADGLLSSSSSSDLARLITCVYYLNENWQPEHEGQIRVYVKDGNLPSDAQCHWDIAPQLDTLVMFRSYDVEHEVLPTFHDRMALTIWYYGKIKHESVASATVSSVSTPPSSTPTRPPPLSITSLDVIAIPETIFVAIPSYRDSECRHTIDDLLSKAMFPGRITVGVCLQSDESDDTRRYLHDKYPQDKVRVYFVDYRHAAGPCVARAHAQNLWHGEQYYLQIDSHMRFRRGWDVFLLDQLKKCPSPKPILTTYPLGYTLPNNIPNDTRPTILCASHFDSNGILRQVSKRLKQKRTSPHPSLFWAAGCAFSSAQVIQEVPYDDSLRFLFFGEEATMSARLWTSGWDFFAPTEAVVYHLWSRAYRPVFQEIEDDETIEQRKLAQAYVHALLRTKEADPHTKDISDDHKAGKFELGPLRGLSEYQEFIGVNFGTQTIEWRAEWANLDPILFDLEAAQFGAT